MMLLAAMVAEAQIVIGGSVYGGGNEGNVGSNSSVTVRAGNLGKVFGGACMADVGGHAFVNIDGEHASDYILINYVYGGNDISGSIGTSNELPAELTQASDNSVDKTWNAFVRISRSTKEVTTGEGESAVTSTVDDQKIYIGQLFGGGNGEYDLSQEGGTYKITDKKTGELIASNTTGFNPPELGKTYLELLGGSIVYAYGGGNNATVTEKTVICVDNPSAVVNHIMVKDGEVVDDGTEGATDLLDNDRLYNQMGLNPGYSFPNRAEYQIGRLFGGNNSATMAIRPTWKLKNGKIRELFSGGNRGDMTSPEGLLLQINENSTIEVGSVYGGCRMANVIPMENGVEIEAKSISKDDDGNALFIPGGMAARTRILGGHITNVYGGNDITGSVDGGSTVGIYTTVYGDVYGGGNGSYPYTDNPKLKDDPTYGDLYYTVPEGKTSVEALNEFRPHAEQVSIIVAGTEDKPTIIHGSVYCGGNSASLSNKKTNPLVELKMGSYAIIDNVFLGNNGEHMVETHEANPSSENPWEYHDGVLRTMKSETIASDGTKYNSIDLTDADLFAKYMEGAAMNLMPRIVFANGDPVTYEPYKSSIGSFYCGGNRGSMTYPGTNNMDFSVPVYIYNKVVGGCNNATVDATDYNAHYEGGIIGSAAEQVKTGDYSFTDESGNIKDRLVLKFGDGINGGVQFTPKRWNDDYTALEWNVIDASTGAKVTPVEIAALSTGESDDVDLNRRLDGGHIFGGCYNSGVVNGNVVINMNSSTVDRDLLFDAVAEDSEGEEILYGESQLTQDTQKFNITERRTGVLLARQGMDVLGTALNVFGGGKGKDTEIWGSTTINLARGYTFQIFGGSEEGVIGRSVSSGDYTFNGKKYKYDPKYSCTVNLCGDNDGVSKQADHSEAMAEAEFIYGGGFFGPICGNTTVNLGKGRVFDTFAGSCMADILGHTETYIGRQVKNGTVTEGFPYIRDMVYGGNDLGGSILNEADFTSRVRTTAEDDYDAIGKVHNTGLLKASAYIEYTQGRADAIFGGCYGTYDYKDSHYSKYFYATEADDIEGHEAGEARSGYTKPRMGNAFVNFRPTLTDALKSSANNRVGRIYGSGQGYPGDADRDIMQRSSYILVDIPQTMDDGDVSHYRHMEVFGGGAWSGVGMQQKDVDGTTDMTPATFNAKANAQKDLFSANIDLARGYIGAAYGGSLSEGVTRRTWVNVPTGSTIKLGSIFAGAYGTVTMSPCDVIEGHVEYHSGDALLVYDPGRKEKETDDEGNETEVDKGNALMKGAIYGGNNNHRRTIYGKINIDVPVRQHHYQYGLTTGTVYGAGYGQYTWNEYTEVNLKDGANVYEVYGGGEAGGVMSAESIEEYYNDWKPAKDDDGSDLSDARWAGAWTLGGGYDAALASYASNDLLNLNNTTLVRTAEMDNRSTKTYKYNTNVIINEGAYVGNYAYGGGRGKEGQEFYGSGDVYGTTYIALLGGIVNKDIYAAGTIGAVYNLFGGDFTASANAYIAGGTCRNVYGGGWEGDVGYTPWNYTQDGWSEPAEDNTTPERPGETNVVIGIRSDQTDTNLLSEIQKVKAGGTKDDYGFLCGVPAIQRNAYAGGEGGAVFGTANLVLNNGYIGYVHLNAGEEQNEQGKIVTAETATAANSVERYEDKINDDTYYDEGTWKGANRLRDCGNIFGGGYDVRSCVDQSNVIMWNGTVRNSLLGGGEIATIGRGSTKEEGAKRTLQAIYSPGKTCVTMYNGHVLRNVFGGGKGYNIWGYGQQGTLYTDGYVFGQTEVQIHGGEIGTEEGVADGYGNVFGGGDIGYVYSKGYFDPKSRVTSTGSPGHTYYYYTDENGDNLVEDCKVVVAPYLQVKGASITYGGKTYAQYDYVPTDYLNTLPKKAKGSTTWPNEWNTVVTEDASGDRGITIRNAVFGGGNVSSNSDTQYANATTVYGNTTATLYDVYHRDFITVGTEHTGGLYGGGNLSLVDGYRELNITNYGTDYYGLESQITLDQYRALSSRERAYFQLEYICNSTADTNSSGTPGITINGQFYENGKRISEEDYLKLLNNPDKDISTLAKNSFTPYGFCSIYAGRLLNTIQRADMCGVFGSRMVLQGSRDRVVDVADDTEYTINRVGELSLNQQRSVAGDTDNGAIRENDAIHGNYFGIYSLVNYMGNLTSDVHFGDLYVDRDGHETEKSVGTTFYSYKRAIPTSNSRNYGQSRNQVALASGVFLELTTENSTEDDKDYGYITGVVELDLINVRKDNVGGGFVYAKNEHRVPKYFPKKSNVLLSAYNQIEGNEARTYKRYYYDPDAEDLPEGAEAADPEIQGYTLGDRFGDVKEFQTSGNFIHYKKQIVDDCYPTNNAYIIGSENYSEAHYWYVKGQVYIYDQKVSAYTGAASAYSRAVHLPLTITAASFGQLQLLNVKPNLYAYKTVDDNGNVIKIGTKVGDKTYDHVWVNNDNDGYTLNEVVTWWDWHQMSATDRSYFRTETFINTVACTIDGTEYAAGEYVLDETDLTTFKSSSHTVTNSEGEAITDLDDLFRSSNNIGHDTGYLLTLDMDTPGVWDDRYIHKTVTDPATPQKTKEDYNKLSDADKGDWLEGPTFTPKASGVYGQREIEQGDIVTTESVSNSTTDTDNPASMDEAYVATEAVTYTYGGQSKTINAGSAISKAEWEAIGSPSTFARAYVCTQTVKLDEQNYLLYGELKTQAQITTLQETYSSVASDITSAMKEASICTEGGNFGGQSLEAGTNYSALQTWNLFPASDRIDSNGNYKFNYNYDAFDVLSDPKYLDGTKTDHGELYLNPDHTVTVAAYQAPYTDVVSVDYDAVFHAPKNNKTMTIAYSGGTVSDGGTLTRAQYETVRNDKRHYTHVSVKDGGETLYFAKENFTYNGVPYGKGQEVDEEIYNDPNYKSKVLKKEFTNETGAAQVQYFRYETYEGDPYGREVISDSEYQDATKLVNDQQYFTIQGKEPTETTTLYVSRDSEIKDVMSNRVYTVVYQYTYYEDDDQGGIKLTNELHVINIRIELESGAPTIGMLYPPGTVLPSSAVGLTRPDVQPGLYEVLTSGWEIFNNENDALHHRNGAPFVNNETPVYWYQNQKNYVAFYSKTYLGKAYSNPVPLSVANYHDMDAVMKDKEHHMYVDHPSVDRPSKIYIDNRTCESDPEKSELDLLKDFFDLSVLDESPAEGSPLAGHALLNDRVKGGNNLEFFLNSNVVPKKYTDWTPIGGGSDPCFAGNLHGDGHYISGLSNSLFGSLCGSVYNLGVRGTFTTAGVADTGEGFVENCWTRSSATALPDGASKTNAVFGNPSANESDCTQLLNCYFWEGNKALYNTTTDATTGITTSGGNRGTARAMTAQQFYNGEVAYDLNGYYLAKRYYDVKVPDGSPSVYRYLKPNADGTLPTDMSTAKYPITYAYYTPEVKVGDGETQPHLGYVEWRFYDGDFRYANGQIPTSNDMRMRVEGEGNSAKTYYTPIWPDDYLFFGQALNYDHVEGRTHQDVPSPVNKASDRIETSVEEGNRVYRAPAYFRSKQMGVAHFNAAAVFAKSKKGDDATLAYKDMTAIDFTGYQDPAWSLATVSDGLAMPAFCPPLLDDEGLTGFQNIDLTKNLLVYTGAPASTNSNDIPTAAQNTAAVVSTYLHDEAYVETNDDYRTVDAWDRNSDNIHGHWVQLSGDCYTTTLDHMLVDREDFNAPIGYQMGTDNRMWYQRTPDNYVDRTKGWEGISLPFTAELVTTQQKGELTHFYGGSTIGHEYWLRQFEGNLEQAKDDENYDISGVYTADFNYPAATTTTTEGLPRDKNYTNTFLWDYYYNNGSMAQHDANADTYQEYYRTAHTHENYAYAQAATPYIVGFPGPTYYEFDLSGKWTASNTGTPEPEIFDQQVITFASNPGITIGVSDDETGGTTQDGLTFKPSYMNETFKAGTATYTLSADGSSYDKVPAAAAEGQPAVADTEVAAFRPYFTGSPTNARTRGIDQIIFSQHDDSLVQKDNDPGKGEVGGGLSIYAKRKKIVVESSLGYTVDVRIVNVAGITLNAFTIEAGETVETRVNVSGVYIVETTDSRYTKKLAVK